MTIISASRRTDIPAFYMPWFMKRLKAGFAEYPNPFNQNIARVSLKPEDVHSIVFWSKNYQHFVHCMDELHDMGYSYCLHYTITGAQAFYEPNVPSLTESFGIVEQLAKKLSPEQLFWRFDPIVLTDQTSKDLYLKQFQFIASTLHEQTRQCFISFVQLYKKVNRQFKHHSIELHNNTIQEMRDLVKLFSEIAADYGIELKVCSQDGLIEENAMKAACIDGEYLKRLFPEKQLDVKKSPTRKGCGCSASKDIGMYDSCRHGCVYCYANQDMIKPLNNEVYHNPEATTLLSY